ncbi:Na+/H+ antiporter NhaA, partial [Terrisporobacter glycolicus]
AGLEIKEEVLYGSLSSFKKASFPVIASIGGVIMPAIIFTYFNLNTNYINGICIPISTDIAFSMGIYFLFSKYLNPSIKMFLLSLAVVDDLVSIILIGTVYSSKINLSFFILALICLIVICIGNKAFKFESIFFYLLLGLFLWYFIHLSGIHSTLSGILLAIVIPTKSYKRKYSVSHFTRKFFNIFNNFIIIPLFAFANTGVSIDSSLNLSKYPTVFLGIYLGLLIGKPLGIMLFTYISNLVGLSKKPRELNWASVFIVSLISSIGFTMSIFVSEVAYVGNMELISISRLCILISSSTSIILSSLCIKTFKELHIL